jgi:hypothetical protein
VLIEGQRIAGYHSSASVALSHRDRREIGAQHVRVPACLVTWIAKDIHAPIDGKDLRTSVATVRSSALLARLTRIK